jgi:hypothetical protein
VTVGVNVVELGVDDELPVLPELPELPELEEVPDEDEVPPAVELVVPEPEDPDPVLAAALPG